MQSILQYDLLPKNKYTSCYLRLVEEKLKSPKVQFITEKHHIYPICVFGHNNITVNLTHREHFIAHLLLYKSYLKEYGKFNIWVKKLGKTVSCYKYTNSEQVILTSRMFHSIRVNYYKMRYLDNT